MVLKEKIKNLNLKLNNNKKCVIIFELINNELNIFYLKHGFQIFK
jgi:hypothetical protein